MNKPRKKNVIALLAGVVVTAAVTASAATLGGLTTESLGANSNDVAAPVTEGVTVTWETGYSPSEGHYVVNGFDLTASGNEEIPADAEVHITLTGAGGNVLAEYVSENGGKTYSPGTSRVVAHEVHNASVLIVGGSTTGDAQ